MTIVDVSTLALDARDHYVEGRESEASESDRAHLVTRSAVTAYGLTYVSSIWDVVETKCTILFVYEYACNNQYSVDWYGSLRHASSALSGFSDTFGEVGVGTSMIKDQALFGTGHMINLRAGVSVGSVSGHFADTTRVDYDEFTALRADGPDRFTATGYHLAGAFGFAAPVGSGKSILTIGWTVSRFERQAQHQLDGKTVAPIVGTSVGLYLGLVSR